MFDDKPISFAGNGIKSCSNLNNLTGHVTNNSSLRLSQWIDNLEEVIKFLGDQKNRSTMEAAMFFWATMDVEVILSKSCSIVHDTKD